MIEVLVVPADGSQPLRKQEVKPTLAVFQELVGGYIEPVVGRDWMLYANEDGIPLGLRRNERATSLALICGWHGGQWLYGDVVFLGSDESTVPSRIATALEGLG